MFVRSASHLKELLSGGNGGGDFTHCLLPAIIGNLYL